MRLSINSKAKTSVKPEEEEIWASKGYFQSINQSQGENASSTFIRQPELSTNASYSENKDLIKILAFVKPSKKFASALGKVS